MFLSDLHLDIITLNPLGNHNTTVMGNNPSNLGEFLFFDDNLEDFTGGQDFKT
jgi:hypothetical protein